MFDAAAVSHDENKDYGAAIRSCFTYARGHNAVIFSQ
jgi:hypothetical protein